MWTELLTVLGVAGGAVLATALVRRRRRSTWQRFAEVHGLGYEIVEGRPLVHGTERNREIELRVAEPGSDTGELGVVLIRMQIEITGVPADLCIEPKAILTRSEHESSGDLRELEVVAEEAPLLLERFRILGSDPAEVWKYLNAARIRALLALDRHYDVELVGSRLAITSRSVLSQPTALEAAFLQLRGAAEQLDGA